MSLNVAPLRQVLLSGVTTGTSADVDCSMFRYIAVFVGGSGTTSSGVVTIEEADYNPPLPQGTGTDTGYSGTWSSMATVNASSVSGGAVSATHFGPGAYRFIRARVSTTIGGGGSISVVLAGA